MKSFAVALGALCLLTACATSRDQYYILTAQPSAPSERGTSPAIQVTLSVSLPSLVDRSQMVLNTTADGVVVLEHERWAAPLTDLMTQTLAQDVERRRGDLLVAAQGGVMASGPVIEIAVTVVQMTLRKSGKASIETHWRIFGVRTGKDLVGSGLFSVPIRQESYRGVAQAVSECLGLLADRLVADMPHVE